MIGLGSIDTLVSGAGGKSGLRQDIERLLSAFPNAPGDGAEVRAAAKTPVREIEEFNLALIELHDALDPKGPSLTPEPPKVGL